MGARNARQISLGPVGWTLRITKDIIDAVNETETDEELLEQLSISQDADFSKELSLEGAKWFRAIVEGDYGHVEKPQNFTGGQSYGRILPSSIKDPKQIEAFANEMYDIGSTEENVNAWMRDAPLREDILVGEVLSQLEMGQFCKHVPGTLEYEQYAQKQSRKGMYGPSYLTISEAEAQALIERYKGTGILSRKGGHSSYAEVITNNNRVVGMVVDNQTGIAVQTTVFKIHYGPRGTHLVPDYPSKKGAKGRK